MRRPIMTMQLARSIGTDAGNRSARKAGRSKWNHDDYNAACEAMTAALLLVN